MRGGSWRQWPLLGPLRAAVRRRYFDLVRRTALSNDGRGIAAGALGEAWLRPPRFSDAVLARRPYPELGGAAPGPARPAPVFITARFRTGSTLLWNIFRHVDACTAYYEPLNERRWFRPSLRREWVDPTHQGVEDYWREYDGLSELEALYREEWTRRRLYMDGASSDLDLQAYLDVLIARARRVPVLQFNRVDFRLPWLRAAFPRARLIHLYRNPRDQWCSALVQPASTPRDVTLDRFQPYDHFFLCPWAEDLKYHFPFLDPARRDVAYRAFYYLWKLSYYFGTTYAHHSLAFEALVEHPSQELAKLMAAARIADYDEHKLLPLIGQSRSGQWRRWADAAWFERHEAACEETLAAFWATRRPDPALALEQAIG